jgi:hypothetical protein
VGTLEGLKVGTLEGDDTGGREGSCCVGEACGLEMCAEAEESRARRVRDDLFCCVRTGQERRGEERQWNLKRGCQRQRGSCLS